MKKIVILLLVALGFSATAQDRMPLSDNAFASVIICGPGDEFYTTFGHAAIRICDPNRGFDSVYNYGTFDFDTKNFYLKFAMGRLDYCISRSQTDNYLYIYQLENRAVWEQRLELTNQEVNNLYTALNWNYQPENRYYRYDFFRDNCATRVRDMVNSTLAHRTLFVDRQFDSALTYRQLIYPMMDQKLEWWRFGCDLLLGAKCDKPCSTYEYMFLPKEILVQLDTTRVSNTQRPLTSGRRMILADHRAEMSNSFSPVVLFWIVFAIILCATVAGWQWKWRLQWIDAILFGLAGLMALFLMVMWFASAHYCTKLNFNLLWASPLFIYLAIALSRSNRVVVIIQTIITLLAIVVTLVGWPQHINIAVLPIELALLLRLTYMLLNSAPSKR